MKYMTNTKSCHAFFHVLRLYCRDRSPKVHSELITKEKMMYREGFKETVVPVVTMVLYFGTETRWNKPTNIKALMDICRKMQASLSAEEIADDLAEDDVALIQKIMDAAKEFAPEYDIDAIYEKVAK